MLSRNRRVLGGFLRITLLVVFTSLFLSLISTVRADDPPIEHLMISEYLGPATCIACHLTEAEQMFGSVHYQQTGPTPNVPNIDGNAGKSERAFNTYCGTPLSSRHSTCSACHVGNGRKQSSQMTPEQLANIDCLMCHQDQYRRVPAGPFETIPVLGQSGQPSTIQAPVEDATGFDYKPDEANMTISILKAARSVHRPTRASCLRCHAGASGSDGGKRGDLSSVTANPPLSSDYHMSPQGENLVCADCHSAGNHRVRGRGLDLRPNDVPDRFTCETCHGVHPHGDYNRFDGTRRDTHADRVSCQACHIPTFAKDISTEMERDWTSPYFSPAACSGQGGWKPEETRASNVIPSYRWFDGTSLVYALGQVPELNSHGEYELGAPLGSVAADSLAKIHPMKEHRSNSARLISVLADVDGDTDVDIADLAALLSAYGSTVGDPYYNPATDLNDDGAVNLSDLAALLACYGGSDRPSNCGTPGELIPHSTFTYFTKSDFDLAVQAGMTWAGMAGDYEIVNVHTFQTINHGVEVADNALACGKCHASLTGGPVRMNLTADFGYAMKGPATQVCRQCHGSEPMPSFSSNHTRHVRNLHYDCSWCHTFSRPSRLLTMPPG